MRTEPESRPATTGTASNHRPRRVLDECPRLHNRQPARNRPCGSNHLLAALMPHPFAAFYRGKRALVTGHTGFTGGWLVAWLKLLGAKVCGYSLPPSSRPNFFDATLLDRGMTSVFADVRARDTLANTLADFQPEIIFHAAQTASSRDPVDLYSTNVMGTINLLEEARLTGCV